MNKERDQDLARGRTKAMPVDSCTAAVNEASATTVPPTSYDEHQRDALLLICAGCFTARYVTNWPGGPFVCLDCLEGR
jgi:hypothetical protein